MALWGAEPVVPVGSMKSIPLLVEVLHVRHVAQLEFFADLVRAHGGGHVLGVNPEDPTLRCGGVLWIFESGLATGDQRGINRSSPLMQDQGLLREIYVNPFFSPLAPSGHAFDRVQTRGVQIADVESVSRLVVQPPMEELLLARELQDRTIRGLAGIAQFAFSKSEEACLGVADEREGKLDVSADSDAVKVRPLDRTQTVGRDQIQIGGQPIASSLMQERLEERIADARLHARTLEFFGALAPTNVGGGLTGRQKVRHAGAGLVCPRGLWIDDRFAACPNVLGVARADLALRSQPL